MSHRSLNHSQRLTKPLRQFSKHKSLSKQVEGRQFEPPEDWHEPTGKMTADYRVIKQPPGKGFRHIVSEREIRQRLDLLPQEMLCPLDVIQLSEMTRKKRRFPCYGMQWGSTLYLYPVESSLVEFFARPPKPALRIETKAFGGHWIEEQGGAWRLEWTEKSLKDFYLNNVLIHELGHLLDERNTSYIDRERFAEWFAIEFGAKKTAQKSRPKKSVRRHHKKKR